MGELFTNIDFTGPPPPRDSEYFDLRDLGSDMTRGGWQEEDTQVQVVSGCLVFREFKE